jgi:hypothetical protein
MLGPMDFTTNDECGVLVGAMTWSRWCWNRGTPYYRELLEGVGMSKTMDMWMWRLAMGS